MTNPQEKKENMNDLTLQNLQKLEDFEERFPKIMGKYSIKGFPREAFYDIKDFLHTALEESYLAGKSEGREGLLKELALKQGYGYKDSPEKVREEFKKEILGKIEKRKIKNDEIETFKCYNTEGNIRMQDGYNRALSDLSKEIKDL